LKSNEDFRASVYARAEREKTRLAARRQKTRSASLSVAMVLLVAALAIPITRGVRTGGVGSTAPVTEQQVLHVPNRAAPLVLLMSKESGKAQAVALETREQNRDFAKQYKAAANLGDEDSLPMPAADTARELSSKEELVEYLTELLEASGIVTLDYDEAFFLDNSLYAMPMELAPQLNSAAREQTTIPDATIPDGEAVPDAETNPGETTAAAQTLPDGGLLQGADVKALLLVPVGKG
jgi:hypothetical protein